MASDIRIPVSRLKAVQDVVFGRKAWRGPDLAARIKTKHVTLWSWFNRNGLPVKHSDQIADELDRRAEELHQAAMQLRIEANKVINDTVPVTADVQDIQQATA